MELIHLVGLGREFESALSYVDLMIDRWAIPAGEPVLLYDFPCFLLFDLEDFLQDVSFAFATAPPTNKGAGKLTCLIDAISKMVSRVAGAEWALNLDPSRPAMLMTPFPEV